jgi:hypothetical protein
MPHPFVSGPDNVTFVPYTPQVPGVPKARPFVFGPSRHTPQPQSHPEKFHNSSFINTLGYSCNSDQLFVLLTLWGDFLAL